MLFDDARHAVLIASNDYFSESTQTLSVMANLSSEFTDIQLGIASSFLSLPAGFTHETVIVFSADGINDVVLDQWSPRLLALYPTQRVQGYDDVMTSHLGYWTDNGAYYYAYNFRENLSTRPC